MQLIDTSIDRIQALVLGPTRELALQNARVVADLGEYLKVKVQACVGGTMVKDDIINLKKGVHVIVATPGRIIDLIKRDFVKLDHLLLFILDEADEMLSRGFKTQIQEIFKFLPPDVQVGLFSATMPQEIFQITKDFMRDPVRILVQKDKLTLEGIRQYYVAIPEEKYKFNVLSDIYKNIGRCCAHVQRSNRLSSIATLASVSRCSPTT